MSVPQALRISRTVRGVSQSGLVPYSQQMVSAIERGERQVAPCVAPHLATKLDYPALYLEMARELTGGFGPAWLNGPNVDLHCAAVREKALEELGEAVTVIEHFDASRPPLMDTEREHKQKYAHLLQVFDAVVAAYHYVGIQCLEYNFSMLQVSRDHYNKLRSKHYVE